MVTSKECLKRYGEPEKEYNMRLIVIPEYLHVDAMPKRIYCNLDMVEPLFEGLRNVKEKGLGVAIRTWDGCFNIRKKKSGITPSLHSWGIAFDINAAWNGYQRIPTMPKLLVECFVEAGFDWGGNWVVKDGMHFQLSKLP